MRLFIKYQLPLILYAVLIFIVSSIPKLPEPELGIQFLDKIAHAVEFAILFILTFRALRNPPIRMSTNGLYITALIISIGYAALDETHQIYVPGRQADIMDFVADTVGIIGSAFVYSFLGKKGSQN